MTSSPPAFAERDFRKASASNPDKQCVRVARRGHRVELRDDKTAFRASNDHRLVFTDVQFDAFLAGVRSGNTTGLCLEMTRRTGQTYVFRSTVPQPSGADPELQFTESEVVAFLDGITRGEFDQDAITDMAVCA